MKKIVLGISGSIAAYRAADIAGGLVKLGHEVTAVMTQGGSAFVTPLTLQTLTRNPVITDLFDEKEGWQPGHIELADNADLLLLAPATAHLIAQLAAGLAPDALTAIALATRAPVLVAPAMNGKMWSHPATERNVETLKGWGHEFIGPDKGMLACGYEGTGKLWPIEGIVEAAHALLEKSS